MVYLYFYVATKWRKWVSKFSLWLKDKSHRLVVNAQNQNACWCIVSVFRKISCVIPNVHATNVVIILILMKRDRRQGEQYCKKIQMHLWTNYSWSGSNQNWLWRRDVTARRLIVLRNIVSVSILESSALISVIVRIVWMVELIVSNHDPASRRTCFLARLMAYYASFCSFVQPDLCSL